MLVANDYRQRYCVGFKLWKNSLLQYFFFEVCAQDKYTGPEETWYPPSLWQFEEANDPRSGELVDSLKYFSQAELFLLQNYSPFCVPCFALQNPSSTVVFSSSCPLLMIMHLIYF